ncbi:MAG TPA: hypothetical protein VMX55_15325 [candidate division Zixibacteria bacterium]|nr:hypothetical protein [candidate division Zixibacteria bacterium]
MYNTKHLLSTLKNEQINSKSEERSIQIEILCPYTQEKLKSSVCSRCEYCQTFKGKHNSGRTLTSLICIYGQENGSDEK